MDKNVVLDSIKNAQTEKLSKEAIYLDLLNQGATIDEIEWGLKSSTSIDEKEHSQQQTIKVVLAVAVTLIGAAVFSFIASNWQYWEKPEKISIIVFFTIVFHLAAWYTGDKKDYPRLAGSLAMLGTVVYGSGIFLIGQIFNASAQWPDGFILWMLGSFAVAWSRNSYSHWALGLALSVIALFGHPFSWFDLPFGFSSVLLTSGILLFVSSAATLVSGFYLRRKIPTESEVY